MNPSLSTRIILILAGLLVVLLAFEGGVAVGYRKAAFSYNWNQSYLRGMDDPHSIFAPFMGDGDDLNPHGTVGSIVSVRLPEIMVKGNGTAEQIVLVGPTTTIRYFRQMASSTMLAAGMQVVVIGQPDSQGRIQAAFVRVLPPPGSTGRSMSPPPIAPIDASSTRPYGTSPFQP